MVPPKHKNDTPRLGNLQFLTLWILGHILSWVLALGANRFLFGSGVYIHNPLILALLMALGPGIPISITQVLLVERGLKKSMQGWLPLSLVGWLLSGLAFSAAWNGIPAYAFDPTVQRLFFIPLFLPVAVLQYLWLRRQGRHAVLWLLSTVTGAVLFSMAGDQLGSSFGVMRYVLAAVAAIFYSAATGSTMLYLLMQQSGKAKHTASDSDADSADDQARLTRLSDLETDSATTTSDLAQAGRAAKITS